MTSRNGKRSQIPAVGASSQREILAVNTVVDWLDEAEKRYPLLVSSNETVRFNRLNSILNVQIPALWDDIPSLLHGFKEIKPENDNKKEARLLVGFTALTMARLAREACITSFIQNKKITLQEAMDMTTIGIRTYADRISASLQSNVAPVEPPGDYSGVPSDLLPPKVLPDKVLISEPSIATAIAEYTKKGQAATRGGPTTFVGCVGLASVVVLETDTTRLKTPIIVPAPIESTARAIHLSQWER